MKACWCKRLESFSVENYNLSGVRFVSVRLGLSDWMCPTSPDSELAIRARVADGGSLPLRPVTTKVRSIVKWELRR